MPSKLKTRIEYKCRYDELACQLLTGSVNIHQCKTDEEVSELNQKYIALAKKFIERVSPPSGEIKA